MAKQYMNRLVRSALQELLFHLLLLTIIFSLCYCNRKSTNYLLHHNVYSEIVDKSSGFRHVNSSASYFTWLRDVAIPWLLPLTDYRGQELKSQQKMFTNNWNLYRIGPPRLRQMRMTQSESCSSSQVESHFCVEEYQMSKEDTSSYCVGWRSRPCPIAETFMPSADAWLFTSALDIWGIPVQGEYDLYGGGGYIANLDINSVKALAITKELHQHLWIDRQTRAVFLEFTLYAPNVNSFVFVSLLTEFTETGAVIPFANVYTFSKNSSTGALGTYMFVVKTLAVVALGIAFLYIFYTVFKRRKAVLSDFWFLLDVFATSAGLAAAGVYVTYQRLVSQAISKMIKDHRKFVNFQHVIISEFLYIIFLAFLLAAVMIRLLKLASYSKKTSRVYHILKLALKDLPAFFLLITIGVINYAMIFTLVFGTTNRQYRSLYTSVSTLTYAILGNTEFRKTNSFGVEHEMTIVFCMLFGVMVLIIMSNLIQAALLGHLTLDAQKNSSDIPTHMSHVFQALWSSFVNRLLFKKRKDSNEKTSHENNSFEDLMTRISVLSELLQQIQQRDEEQCSQKKIENRHIQEDIYNKKGNTIIDLV